MRSTTTEPLIVLGAGCAGLSLAAALLRAGVRDPIVVLDRRDAWPDDRTWCFWDTGGIPHADLAGHAWPAWTIQTSVGRTVARGRRHRYVHLRSRELYDRLLGVVEAAPNCELRTGVTVTGVREDARGVEVITSAGSLRGSRAWDAMGGAGPLLRGRPDGAVELRQAFLGQEVETATAAFDPGVASLMDFRVSQEDGLHFVYVLPFSPTRALVEDTHVRRRPVAPAVRRATLQRYLGERCGVEEFTVRKEERGSLAMTSWGFPAVRSPRLAAVGAAAGAVRPSSGYAFVRLQRHVDAVAAAVAAGRPLPSGLQSARRVALDRLFLHALDAAPERFPERFRSLAAGVPGDVFARFMSDSSSLMDEARVIAALPSRPFLAAVPRAVGFGGGCVARAGRTDAVTGRSTAPVSADPRRA